MANADSLAGVRKWLDREEWRGLFDDLLQSHLGAPCEEAGIALEELGSVLGDGCLGTLIGCVFEDTLATELVDGSNIVDDYLKRRGWKESVPNKRYMTALRSSVMSLYEVSDVVRDQSFLARDLLRGGKPVRVSEKLATRSLKDWDWIAGRIVQVGPRMEMGGGVLPLRREAGEIVRDGFFTLRRGMRAEILQLLRERKGDANPSAYTLDTEVLRRSAFVFTNAWLVDALNPQMPTVVNGDGDTMVLTTVRYPLNAGADRAALEEALTATPDFRRTDDDRWEWVGSPAAPARGEDRPAGAESFVTTLPDGMVSMAQVVLEVDTLRLEVNSLQRANKARARLEPVIGPFAGSPVVESKTIEEAMASRPAAKGSARPANMSPEEEDAIVLETLERHYRRVLDEPVPMLDDVSPREAAKTKAGRMRLVAWLKGLENANARQPAGSAIARYDVSWMWEELGVADLRR